MTTVIKRRVFDFLTKGYATTSSHVEIIPDGFDLSQVKAQPGCKDDFIQRWHLTLMGETKPLVSKTTVTEGRASDGLIYLYDCTFGMTLIKGFYWDWMEDLCEESALAVHVVLEPIH